jgi:zinc transporter ZupT
LVVHIGRPLSSNGRVKSSLRSFLQVSLGLMAGVMIVAGSITVLIGAESVLREGSFTTDIDSEMRFYAVWYVAAGILLARAIPRVEDEGFTIKLVGAAFFVAGCARALSWAAVGRPHVTQVVLMVIELVLPFVIIPLQALVARKSLIQEDHRPR